MLLVFGMNSVEHFHTAICVIALVGMLTEVSLQHHLFFLLSNEKVCGLALQHYFLSLFSERLVTDVSTHYTTFSLCLKVEATGARYIILSSVFASKVEAIGVLL